MASRRKERLADQVRDEVSRILLYEMSDPRTGFMTVTRVDLSNDLRRAVVGVSVLGDGKTQAITLNVIKHARGFIQRELTQRLNTRFVPTISFEVDDTVKRSVRFSEKLRDIMGNGNGNRE